MNTRITYNILSVCGLLLFVALLAAVSQQASVHTAQAAVQETVTVALQKKFSGPVPEGYTADLFSFIVKGDTLGEQVVTLTHDTDVTANGSIDLPIGEYTIEEVGPNDFVPGEWRPGWYGDACEGNSDFETTITVDESNVDHGTIYCQADNQWRYGTLRVVKEFVGTTTDYENFEFTVTQGETVKYDGPFDTDGDMEIVVGEGAYVVEETVYAGYAPSYSEECEGVMDFEGSATCTITNTYKGEPYSQSTYYSQSSYGGGNGTTTYLVFGYVWHDENSNMCWEGFDCEDEATTTEPDLDGWTVTITNGSTTHSTTTNAEGYYYFYVPAGTWTISEVVQTDWTKTYPSENGHVVEVGGDFSQGESITLFAQIIHFFLPTVFAQSQIEYGPFNFGNNFSGGGYSQGSYGGGYGQGSYGGGGSSSPRCDVFEVANEDGNTVTLRWETTRGDRLVITEDGDEIYEEDDDDIVDEGELEVTVSGNGQYELTVYRSIRSDECTLDLGDSGRGGGNGSPDGEVLGETLPIGGPATGAGGTAAPLLPTLSAILQARTTVRLTQHGL